ncbi:MAG: MFS transporter [Bacteroidia bacterium]|nr:MFS transporter [Bacteroidia bacterium]
MQKARIAVSTLFFVNGFVYANWTARLPEIQRYFGLDNTSLGTLLLVAAAGALTAMPLAGWITASQGTKRIILLAGLSFCIFVAFIPIFPNVYLAGAILYFVGFSTGAMDVAMNGQAVEVEKLYKKAIMSSFHAIFSIGMALGAGSGALFAKFGIELPIHFLSISILGLISIVLAIFFLVPDSPISQNEEGESSFRLPTKAILPLGIIGFCGMSGEGAMSDWSAIFMNTVVGQNESISALAFGTFGVSMTIGRIFGDYFTNLVGKRKLLIIDSILAILGLGLALAFATPFPTLLGFFIIGLGLSTVVPIVYSTAGNTPGVSPSTGIAMATTIGYAGFFVGPPLIGFLADLAGLRLALVFVWSLFILMFLLVLRFIPGIQTKQQ